MAKHRVFLSGVLFFIVFASNFAISQKTEDSGSEKCVVDDQYNDITDASFVELKEQNNVIIDNYRLNIFPNVSYWMWFAVSPELVNVQKWLDITTLKWKKSSDQEIANQSLKFEAADCDWLESMVTSNITCACTLPSHLTHYFRFSFSISYKLPYQKHGMYYLIVGANNGRLPMSPLFLPKEKELVLQTSKKMQDEAMVNYEPGAFEPQMHCTDYDYGHIVYVQLSTESKGLVSHTQLGMTPFNIDYGIRQKISKIGIRFRSSACENNLRLWMFDKDESCTTEIALEDHPVYNDTVFGKLPSMSACNCSYPEGLEERYWRMGVHLDTSSFLCFASFGFVDHNTLLYGVVSIQTIAFDSEKKTNLHMEYYTDTLLYESDSSDIIIDNEIDVEVGTNDDQNDDDDDPNENDEDNNEDDEDDDQNDETDATTPSNAPKRHIAALMIAAVFILPFL